MKMNNMETVIRNKLVASLSPVFLNVINESGKHNVPPGSESHFKLLVVSTDFEGCNLLNRHRTIHELLAQELQGGIHALSIEALTPDEWKKRGQSERTTPPCLGSDAS